MNGHGGRYYDGHALEVVRLAADFGRYGVEPRHLKQWKSAADRQADVIEQVVAPLRRQRNPQARRQSSEAVDDMAAMAVRFHRAFLRGRGQAPLSVPPGPRPRPRFPVPFRRRPAGGT